MFKNLSYQQLGILSRDKSLLFRLAIAIGLIFTVIAFLVVGKVPDLFSNNTSLQIMAGELMSNGLRSGNLETVMSGVRLLTFNNAGPLVALLTFVVSVLWFCILVKITSNRFSISVILFGVAAVALGFASAAATLVSSIWHSEIQGFTAGDQAMQRLFFFVGSVGFREETIKFLFFLPLVPFLYRTRNPALILLAASCVGLGFAAEENRSYLGMATLGRYVSANFLHLALTGTLGYAFCRFLYTPRQEWDRFIATYLGVIVVHGVYDFLLGVGGGGSLMAIMVFAYTCYYFFDLIANNCPAKRRAISPLAVFILGCATLFGLSLTLTAAALPSFHDAVEKCGPDLFASIPLMFIYINRFRDA